MFDEYVYYPSNLSFYFPLVFYPGDAVDVDRLPGAVDGPVGEQRREGRFAVAVWAGPAQNAQFSSFLGPLGEIAPPPPPNQEPPAPPPPTIRYSKIIISPSKTLNVPELANE